MPTEVIYYCQIDIADRLSMYLFECCGRQNDIYFYGDSTDSIDNLLWDIGKDVKTVWIGLHICLATHLRLTIHPIDFRSHTASSAQVSKKAMIQLLKSNKFH